MMKLLQLLLSAACFLPTLTRGFNNPVFWEDLADLDVRRDGSTYYYSASTMHYSPGAPILRSYDLVNWEYIGHSVPTLDWGDKYSLINGRAYVQGIWASWLVRNSFQNTWYWGGCVEFGKTYIYTSMAITGPWSRHATLDKCYYDAGMLVDDDGTMYVSYVVSGQIWMAQLSADGTSEVRSQLVFVPPSSVGYLEGSRPYKKDGVYYILLTKPPNGTWMIKSSSPFGEYTLKVLVQSVTPPVASAGSPHQGGLVDTPNGDWYYMGFIDAYPGGRIPVLAPVTWGEDGFPAVTLSNGVFGTSYPDGLTPQPVGNPLGTDYFTSISPAWEWNHNPDTTKFSTGNSGLILRTATVTPDLYQARNTITRRIHGPTSLGTIKLNFDSMVDGDRAGLAMFRDTSAWIGVSKDNGIVTVQMVNGLTMNSGWSTNSTGTVAASAPAPSGRMVWLQITADIAPGGSKSASFAYSSDGLSWTTLGPTFVLNLDWHYFMGYRFGIFNYATSALGGSVTIRQFTMDLPGTTPPNTGRRGYSLDEGGQ